SEELAATAEEMSAQAELLTRTMSYFKLAVTERRSSTELLRPSRNGRGDADGSRPARRAPVVESEYVEFAA
ncbi:MAG TPA: methyl-accepting chemotaxis protein, partial [Zoogloea sp.]|nr:methyl-accepting chemotaxis protein [Rhodocyclaceae bacterium]HNI49571.1 methyl-accepting chemotaxis protein [Zoogloea sp.]